MTGQPRRAALRHPADDRAALKGCATTSCGWPGSPEGLRYDILRWPGSRDGLRYGILRWPGSPEGLRYDILRMTGQPWRAALRHPPDDRAALKGCATTSCD